MKKASTKILVYFAVPVLVGLVVNWLTPITPWSYLVDAVEWFFGFLSSEYTLPLWGIVLLILLIPALCALAVLAFAKKAREKEPTFHSYTKDRFYEIDWNWQYTGNELYPSSIIPRCPNCKTILQPAYNHEYSGLPRMVLDCHNCRFKKDFDVDYDELNLRIRRDIDRKIVTEEYKNIQLGGRGNAS